VPERASPGDDRQFPFPASDDPTLHPAGPAPIDAAEFLGEGEAVDTETGEITPPPGKPILFTVPNKRPTRVASVDDWKATWEGLCNQVINSSRLSPAEKEAKVRLLKKANDGNIRALGMHFIAAMNADLAEKLKAIHAEPAPGGSSSSAASTPTAPADTKPPSA